MFPGGWAQECRREQKGRRGGISRNFRAEGLQSAAGRVELDPPIPDRQGKSECPEQSFRMVTGRRSTSFPHRNGNVTGEPREEEGALDLGTGDRHRVTQGTEFPSPDREGEAIS